MSRSGVRDITGRGGPEKWVSSNFAPYAAQKVAEAYAPISTNMRRKDRRFNNNDEPQRGNNDNPGNQNYNRRKADLFNTGSRMPRSNRPRRTAGASPGLGGGGGYDGSSGGSAPAINAPMRMDLTNLQNTAEFPPRKKDASTDDVVLSKTFSPKAHRRAQNFRKDPAAKLRASKKTSLPRRLATDDTNTQGYKKSIRDSKILANACRRAGREQSEAASYFKMGVLKDNMGQYKAAISCYRKYIKICQSRGDTAGEAAACNCIGVDLHLLARQADVDNDRDEAARQSLLKEALGYHQDHLEIADHSGQFVAHSNLGIIYGDMADYKQASHHHQEALKLAMMVRDAPGQSVAVGNLGLIGEKQGDLESARQCMDQHLQLVSELKDAAAESASLQQLGKLAITTKDYEQARELFEQARDLAEEAGSRGLLKSAKVMLGVATGQLLLPNRLQEMRERMESQI